MFRKIITQTLAAAMLFMASFAILAPAPVYAQPAHNVTLSSRKCDGIKDKKKKKECEKKESSGKRKDDGANHDLNDDHGIHHQ